MVTQNLFFILTFFKVAQIYYVFYAIIKNLKEPFFSGKKMSF